MVDWVGLLLVFAAFIGGLFIGFHIGKYENKEAIDDGNI